MQKSAASEEMGTNGLGRWRRDRFTVADDAFVGVDLDDDHLGAMGDALGPVKGLLVGDPERRRDNLANLHVPSSGALRLRVKTILNSSYERHGNAIIDMVRAQKDIVTCVAP